MELYLQLYKKDSHVKKVIIVITRTHRRDKISTI